VIVVSDTSAIVNLAAVGQLDVLHQLYGTVLIPPAVQSEIAAGGPNAPGAATTSMAWIQTVPVANRSLVASLAGQLDIGEAEAVALALETRADLLLVDERRGRAAATNLGVKVIGLLGVLLEARQKGFVPRLKPVLDDLVSKAGFWMSRALYDSTLRAGGE
jgi:predicted nucleic acid-binding protein